MVSCSCEPGSEENHWFEIRCPECHEADWAWLRNWFTVRHHETTFHSDVPVKVRTVFERDLTGKLVMVYSVTKSSAEDHSPTKIG